MAGALKALQDSVRAVGAARGIDPRRQVFDLRLVRRGEVAVLTGETTLPDAADEVLAAAAAAGLDAIDEVVRLPHPDAPEAALVRSAVAPMYAAPDPDAALLTQYVLGHRVRPLARHGRWWRIQGEDGHIGWVHEGYLLPCEASWARLWETGHEGESVVALDGALADAAGHAMARLPWGARLVRLTRDRYRLPDGREGALVGGEVVDTDRLTDRFPSRGESVARTARRWLGVPYLWGGVTMGGADCSGFVQAVLWMHGIAVPRDSDPQARTGEAVDAGADFAGLRSGDLLFFAEDDDERITHVGLALGGTGMIHSALTNGGVDINDLAGDLSFEDRLRHDFVHARRLLPD